MSDHPPVKIPRVARKPQRIGAVRVAVVLALVGGGVFAGLASGRAARDARAFDLPALAAQTAIAPAPPPPEVAPGSSVLTPVTLIPAPTPVTPLAVQPRYAAVGSATPLSQAGGSAAERARARIAAPALIVDLAQARQGEGLRTISLAPSNSGTPEAVPTASLNGAVGAAPTAAVPAAGSTSDGAAQAASVDPGARDLNSNERFATRSGNRDTEVARAQRLPNQGTLVVQGTIFGAVMETALNSDVPGFARAVTSRDVLSFDGSQVMIPAGSHVIGEYNSGVAQGASRVFIVWTRLIRPDGVSISLASPAVDDLGRGGLGGKVNRHFLQRFGGSILMTVLTGGISAVTQSLARGTTVVVSNSSEATSLAGQAARGNEIPPTIKTRQGANVRIFVARDLDFSAVGPVR